MIDKSIQNKSNNWWRSAAIYQVYPRSFFDSNNDGIGDLPGIIQKLDYIAKLEVDAVWISPFFQSPMQDFGYDISDYCAIESMFGTMDDFESLLAAAHERNLKILIDQVWNHTSEEHLWFVESRSSRDNAKADWYVWSEAKPDGSPPNNWRATFGGSAWEWDETRQQYYLHSFLTVQPDLNWYNPEVQAAILDVARFWLDLGVDGFRLDVVNFWLHDRNLRDNPPRPPEIKRPAGAGANDPFFDLWNKYNFNQPEIIELLKPIRKLMEEYPGTTTLAEISSAEDAMLIASEYVRGNDRLHMAYNSELMTDEPFSYTRLQEIIKKTQTYFEDGVICWTVGTHDFPRLKSRWQKHQTGDRFIQEAFEHLLAALILALKGSCCIYQGDELGLTEAEIPYEKMQDPFGLAGYPSILGRDGCRTPMPWAAQAHQAGFTTAQESWLPISPEHLALAVDLQEQESMSLLNKYRRLFRWRKQQPALLQGNLILLDTLEPLLGFSRKCNEQHLICLFNLSPEPLDHNLSNYPKCIEVEQSGFTNRRYDNTVEIPAYGVFFGNCFDSS
jgi:alpha-glucosidase